MPKINITINIQQTKPEITAEYIQAMLDWIKVNVMDKLPSDASATHTLQLSS